MTAKPTLGTVDGSPLHIDVARLLETRALCTASSGWGKSWLLRRLIEQTHDKGAMQIVIDPEGEFASLRERFDFVIAGKGGDCPAEPRSAELLAHRLLELGTSAVLDLYELRGKPRGANHVTFVRRFLEAMISAPKNLWRPVLVFVDEAHLFAPEGDQAESRDAVRGLMTLGRKRGFCGILATQRLAKLDKDAADASNVLIGRYTLDTDVTRAAAFLGFPKARHPELRRLERGEFFTFGPALSEDLARVRVGPVATTHPRAGQRAAVPPAPRGTVLKVLEQLRDLPAEAETEARTAAELRLELATARKQIKSLETQLASKPAPKTETKVKEVPILTAKDRAIVEGSVKALHALVDKLQLKDVRELADRMNNALVPRPTPADREDLAWARARQAPIGHSTMQLRAEAAARAPRPTNGHAGPGDASLPKGERITLIAIAQHPDGVTREQLTILTGYKRSTRDAYLQRLRERGHIAEGGVGIVATDSGMAALGSDYEMLPTGDALRDHWLAPGRLPEGENRVLRVVCEAHPDPVPREAIDEATGFKRSTRDAYLQRLGARRLVKAERGGVAASAELFG